MRLSTFSVATLLLAAGLLAAGGSDAQARRKDPFAELRTSLDKLFTPPRRARRAKRTPAKEEARTPAKEEQPAASKAASKPAAADQKSHPAEPAARPPGAAEKPPERGRQAEPRPAEPDRRTSATQASREDRTREPRTKRASGPPLKEATTAQNRPAPQGRDQQAEARRRDGPTAAPPPPTKRAQGDQGKANAGASAQAAQPQRQSAAAPRQEDRVAALPPPTKRAYGDPGKTPVAEPETAEPEPPPPPSACQLRLTGDRTVATATMLPRVTAGQCVVDDVVRLEAVVTEDGKRIALAPPATLRCPMAETVVQWLRDDVAPVARELGAGLKSVVADTSFECRSRNHIAGAKLSEHGHANAIDLRGITLTDGTVFRFTDAAADREAREALRKSACARFTTVLGPGSDGYHETHIHLDLAQRRGGYRLCQWDVRDPTVAVIPMPPERPSSAPPRVAAKPRVERR